MLFGRTQGEATVPERVPVPTDVEALAALTAWQDAGALALETATRGAAPPLAARTSPGPLDARRFMRTLDTDWRRTSYSGLIRAEEQLASTAVEVEPEVPGTVDEDSPAAEPVETHGATGLDELDHRHRSPRWPTCPAGATFGSLVHAVLEHADPQAADLHAELRRHVEEQLRWWSVDAAPDELAEALVPMQHTPLGPLAAGLTLADIPLGDRLRELDFEFPLVGGDRPGRDLPDVQLRAVADAAAPAPRRRRPDAGVRRPAGVAVARAGSCCGAT